MCACGYCFAVVDSECASLSFGGQVHYCLDNLGSGEDQAIIMEARCIVGCKEMSTCSTVSIRFGKVLGTIAMCCQDHVTCMIGNDGTWVHSRVIQGLLGLGIELLGGN